MHYLLLLLALICAYLLGSISSAIIICKIFKKPDPRTAGSKNPGATNVLRLVGKKYAIFALLGDILKGFLAVILGLTLFSQTGFALALIGFAVFFGHLYPIFFNFKGGKGVATYLGVLFALPPISVLGLAASAIWLLVAVIFRYSSVAALITAIVTPFYALLINRAEYFFPLIAMSVLLILRHKKNIKNLINKTEDKIGKKNKK